MQLVVAKYLSIRPMKKQFLLVTTLASLALVASTAVLAQTTAPSNPGTSPRPAAGTMMPSPVMPGQGDATAQPSMMPQPWGNYGNTAYPLMHNRMPYGTGYVHRTSSQNPAGMAMRIFVGGITLVLIWIFLVLGIIALYQHIKMCQGKHKAGESGK